MIGFSGGNIFYDSLLVSVAEDHERNRVSSLGFSLGYLGGGLLFLINVLMFSFPTFFGLNSQVEAVLWSFLSVAIWWGVFTVPLITGVKEKQEDDFRKNIFVFWFRIYHRGHCKHSKYESAFLYLLYIGSCCFWNVFLPT